MSGFESTTVPSARISATQRPRVALAMRPPALADDLFGDVVQELGQLADVVPGVLTDLDQTRAGEVLHDVEILITGWGCPTITREILDRAPKLSAVVHTGGSTAAVIDPAMATARGIALSNAGEANAIPVAEFTVAQILLTNKQATVAERLYRSRRAYVDREIELRQTGNYRRTVGLIGASRIGRNVARMLQMTDLQVLVFDPYLSATEVASLNATKVSLGTLLETSDVVSLHAPVTPETREMIGADELRKMADGAVLINTARGALIDHSALTEELRSRRISAVLDVTSPEPLPPTHELWSMPNVTITPHIAGSTGNELRRLGQSVLEELSRFVVGLPFASLEPRFA